MSVCSSSSLDNSLFGGSQSISAIEITDSGFQQKPPLELKPIEVQTAENNPTQFIANIRFQLANYGFFVVKGDKSFSNAQSYYEQNMNKFFLIEKEAKVLCECAQTDELENIEAPTEISLPSFQDPTSHSNCLILDLVSGQTDSSWPQQGLNATLPSFSDFSATLQKITQLIFKQLAKQSKTPSIESFRAALGILHYTNTLSKTTDAYLTLRPSDEKLCSTISIIKSNHSPSGTLFFTEQEDDGIKVRRSFLLQKDAIMLLPGRDVRITLSGSGSLNPFIKGKPQIVTLQKNTSAELSSKSSFICKTAHMEDQQPLLSIAPVEILIPQLSDAEQLILSLET